MLYKTPCSKLMRMSYKEASVEQVFYEYLTDTEIDVKRTLGYELVEASVTDKEFKQYLDELEDHSDYTNIQE